MSMSIYITIILRLVLKQQKINFAAFESAPVDFESKRLLSTALYVCITLLFLSGLLNVFLIIR